MKKVVAFVPVKLNNERLPGKNTKLLGGRPLIDYILSTLKSVEEIDEIYVYCSKDEIVPYLPDGVKFLRRDSKLDSSDTLILEVLKSFTSEVKADIYVLAHATAPFLTKESIQVGINKVQNEGYDSALTVVKLNEFLWRNGVPMYERSKIPRTQDLDEIYAETTGLYVFKEELLREQSRRTGDHPYMIDVSREEAVDINEPLDFLFAQALKENSERNK